mgnify:CR=1 FL=1
MPGINQIYQNEIIIQGLRKEIEALKYNRNLLSDESRTFHGRLNRDSINKKLQEINRQIKQKELELEKVKHNQQQALREPPTDFGSPNVHIDNATIVGPINNPHMEQTTVTKINVKLGDNATISGTLAVATSIENSFNQADSANIPNDLRFILKNLTIAVGKMSEQLSDEMAAEVARDLEKLTAEATHSSPSRKWWEVSIEGLTKAAKSVGEIGKPVLDLVAQIVPILLAISA